MSRSPKKKNGAFIAVLVEAPSFSITQDSFFMRLIYHQSPTSAYEPSHSRSMSTTNLRVTFFSFHSHRHSLLVCTYSNAHLSLPDIGTRLLPELSETGRSFRACLSSNSSPSDMELTITIPLVSFDSLFTHQNLDIGAPPFIGPKALRQVQGYLIKSQDLGPRSMCYVSPFRCLRFYSTQALS